MTADRRAPSLVLSFLMAGGVACAQPDSDAPSQQPPAQDSPRTATPSESDRTAAASDTAFTLRPSDLDAYRVATLAEIARIEQASEQLARAKTGEDTSSVLLSIRPDNSEAAAAERAGVDLRRYRRIRSALTDVLGSRVMGQMMNTQLAGVDTTALPAADRATIREGLQEAARMEDDAYRGLPADVQPLLRRRAAELDSLRLRLAALRLSFGRSTRR